MISKSDLFAASLNQKGIPLQSVIGGVWLGYGTQPEPESRVQLLQSFWDGLTARNMPILLEPAVSRCLILMETNAEGWPQQAATYGRFSSYWPNAPV